MARRQLAFECRRLVVKRALPMCFAMQNLKFPAYVTLAILDELLPAVARDLDSMHFKWEVINAVKHYHDRIRAAAGKTRAPTAE